MGYKQREQGVELNSVDITGQSEPNAYWAKPMGQPTQSPKDPPRGPAGHT